MGHQGLVTGKEVWGTTAGHVTVTGEATDWADCAEFNVAYENLDYGKRITIAVRSRRYGLSCFVHTIRDYAAFTEEAVLRSLLELVITCRNLSFLVGSCCWGFAELFDCGGCVGGVGC
jgi:hypothetical protein